jgi:hypothetical protein
LLYLILSRYRKIGISIVYQIQIDIGYRIGSILSCPSLIIVYDSSVVMCSAMCPGSRIISDLILFYVIRRFSNFVDRKPFFIYNFCVIWQKKKICGWYTILKSVKYLLNEYHLCVVPTWTGTCICGQIYITVEYRLEVHGTWTRESSGGPWCTVSLKTAVVINNLCVLICSKVKLFNVDSASCHFFHNIK